MTSVNKLNGSIDNINETELDIPIDINDIIEVCKQYTQLGWNIQQQIGWLIELGIEESLKEGKVSVEALPHIRQFLKSITEKMFGDTVDQAFAVIMMIDNYELHNPQVFKAHVAN